MGLSPTPCLRRRQRGRYGSGSKHSCQAPHAAVSSERCPLLPLLSVRVLPKCRDPVRSCSFLILNHIPFHRCAFPFSSWRSSKQRYPKFSFVVSTAVLLFPSVFTSPPNVGLDSRDASPFFRLGLEHPSGAVPTRERRLSENDSNTAAELSPRLTLTAGLLLLLVFSTFSRRRRLIVVARKSS